MRTAQTIEAQEARKAEEKSKGKGGSFSQNKEPVSGVRRRQNANLKPFPKGVSGNPGGKPKVDLAAQIARAIFENDGPAIYAAYSKMLRKGSPYAFQVLSDRGFGKLKEHIEHEISPYREMSDQDIKARITELEQQLGFSSPEPTMLPPATDEKIN